MPYGISCEDFYIFWADFFQEDVYHHAFHVFREGEMVIYFGVALFGEVTFDEEERALVSYRAAVIDFGMEVQPLGDFSAGGFIHLV